MTYTSSTSAARKKPAEIAKAEEPRMTALPANKAGKKVPYVKYGMMVAFVFSVLLCIAAANSRVSAVTVEADRMKIQLDELKTDYNALDAKKEQRFNLEYVEQQAVYKLGMVKQDKNQTSYISISNPEKITVAEEKKNGSGIVAGIIKSFNAIVEYLN